VQPLSIDPTWNLPPVASLATDAKSYGEQIIRASANIALHGVSSGTTCLLENNSYFRFPWLYVEAPDSLITHLCTSTGLSVPAFAKLLNMRLADAMYSQSLPSESLGLFNYLLSLNRNTLKTLSTGEMGAVLPDSSVAVGVVRGAIVPSWERMGPGASDVDRLISCIDTLLEFSGSEIPIEDRIQDVSCLAWCAISRPATLCDEPQFRTSILPVQEIRRSALIAQTESLEILSQKQQRFETVNVTRSLASRISNDPRTRELGCVLYFRKLNEPGPQSTRDLELVQSVLKLKYRPMAHLRLEQKQSILAERDQSKARELAVRYPRIWDGSWGEYPVRMLEKLRKAGRRGVPGPKLYKLLGKRPSEILTEMRRSKKSAKSLLALEITRLRIIDSKGQYVYRLYKAVTK